MSTTITNIGTSSVNAQPWRSSQAAKARLLGWADECDARAKEAGPSLAAMAAGGAFAVVGALLIARVISPRRRGVAPGPRSAGIGRQLLIGGFGAVVKTWVIPVAIRLFHRSRVPRTQ